MSPSKSYQTEKDFDGTRLKLTYVPSLKDQREELYEMLNKATQRKATAREDLRQAAANMPVTTTEKKSAGQPGAIKAGFLNKKADAQPVKWRIWVQRIMVIAPVAKNYLLFGGFLVFAHLQGDKLAIPAPL